MRRIVSVIACLGLAAMPMAASAQTFEPDQIISVTCDDNFDPFEVGGKLAPVGVPRLGRTRLPGIETGLHAAERRADLLEGKIKLVGIELLGARAETMPLKRVDDRVQTLDLVPGVGIRALEICNTLVPFGDPRIGRDQHGAEQRGIVGKVRLDQHGKSESVPEHLVNRRSAERPDDARNGPFASPAPPKGRPPVLPSAASRHPGWRATGSDPAQAASPSSTARCRPTRPA